MHFRSLPLRMGIAAAISAVVCAQGLPSFIGQSDRQPEPQMIDLNVVAVDAHGQAVTDLSRDELRVTDAGKPQTITFFHHRDDALTPAATLAPNEVSNRGRQNVPRATMILFDLLNERFGTRGMSANRLIHDLEGLESSEYVYLYALTMDGKLFPIHGMPGPEGETESSAKWTSNIKTIIENAMHALSEVRPVEATDPVYRTQLTYSALDAAASELSRAPGRKSLVWVTDGVPMELGPQATWDNQGVDFTPLLRQMSQVFDRAKVSIYPARQVMMGSPDSMGGPGTTGMESIATLGEFANLTGGRPDSGKDIGAAVRQAVADARTSYQVAYAPPATNWDDKFHKLRVTCTRKGVRIQAKSGYYAWREPSGVRSQEAIASVMKTTFDAAEIGLRASLAHAGQDSRMVRLNARIDAHDLVLASEGDRYGAELRYAIIGYAPGHEPNAGPLTPLHLRLDRTARDKALQEGIPLDQNITLGPEFTQLRLAVFDRGSNAVGSVTLRVR